MCKNVFTPKTKSRDKLNYRFRWKRVFAKSILIPQPKPLIQINEALKWFTMTTQNMYCNATQNKTGKKKETPKDLCIWSFKLVVHSFAQNNFWPRENYHHRMTDNDNDDDDDERRKKSYACSHLHLESFSIQFTTFPEIETKKKSKKLSSPSRKV